MPDTTGLSELLSKLQSSVTNYAGDNKSQLGATAILGILGYLMNQQNANALGGNPYKDALGSLNTQKDIMTTGMNNALAGNTTNPDVATMRDLLKTRATTPTVTPLAVNAPARYNPYATNSSYGQPNQALLSQVLNMAQGGNRSEIQNYGNNALLQSMKNRYTTRPMK